MRHLSISIVKSIIIFDGKHWPFIQSSICAPTDHLHIPETLTSDPGPLMAYTSNTSVWVGHCELMDTNSMRSARITNPKGVGSNLSDPRPVHMDRRNANHHVASEDRRRLAAVCLKSY